MRRLGVIVALGALLGIFAAGLTDSPALAGRGSKWEFVPATPFAVPASYCGFAIQVTPVSNEYIKVLKTPDGSEIDLITGSFTQSYTNTSTGRTITENGSASARLTTNADGSGTVVSTGPTPIFLDPADAQRFGLPTVSVAAGALTYSVDPDGNLTALSLHGHVLADVCAALS